ncbi:MAG TPA: hypothetical protein VGN60_07735 [Devosia sp.]|jgi:hypothetical protein|nr:hypothetical protein [Devosia sp.]
MARTAGLRVDGQGWKSSFYPRPAKPSVGPIPTPEEAAERNRKTDELIARIFQENGVAVDNENDATRKLKDREARASVEGDTDLNHDNVEGAE